MISFLQLFSVLRIIAQDGITPSFYTIYQIRVYIRMIQITEGVSLEYCFFALNIMTMIMTKFILKIKTSFEAYKRYIYVQLI